MRQTLFIFFFLSVFFIHPTEAQTPPSFKRISGRVMVREDDKTQPLEYATVRLLSGKDSSLIAGNQHQRESKDSGQLQRRKKEMTVEFQSRLRA